MPDSPRKSALTIGKLLNLLRASETQIIEGQRLHKIAEARPVIRGSREEMAFTRAVRHFQTAGEYHAQLDNDPNIDALRAKSAAGTGQSFLSSNYVEKLAGELATQQRVGWQAVLEFPIRVVLTSDTNKKKPNSKKRRGRRPDTDKKKDKQIWEAWKTGQYKTFQELADHLKLSRTKVHRAKDRHRQRIASKNKNKSLE